jgi:hypothetical protein
MQHAHHKYLEGNEQTCELSEMSGGEEGMEPSEEKVNPYIEAIMDMNDKALTADGLDEAIIGIVSGAAREPVLLYSEEKVIDILMVRDGMSYEEAVEYYEFNIIGAYMGTGTPLFLMRIDIWED